MGPVIILFLMLSVAFIVGYYIRTKNQERLRLIDKGINPDEGLTISKNRKQTTLKNGILFLSFGIGLFVAQIYIEAMSLEDFDRLLTYIMMLLIFGGIGFLINYFILKWEGNK